jgi:Uma2 family endonuclease
MGAQRMIEDERPLTIAEFEQLPEEDAYHIELVRGRMVRSPRPAPLHGVLMIRLGRRLDEFVQAGGFGLVMADAGAILERDPDTVRGPDVSFYSTERIPEARYATGFWGPPDLAVEITSPSNRASEMQEKVSDYLDAGVRAVWVFDPPTRTVSVYQPDGSARLLRGEDVLEGGDVLPGFRLLLAGFFEV